MKNIFILLTLLITGLNGISASNPVDPPVKWTFKEFNFGIIEKGKPVDAVFELFNDSERPLVITEVKTSCGCTASDYSKEPIMPGENSQIKATYDAAKPGKFTKTVKVYTNQTEEPVILTIRGEVE